MPTSNLFVSLSSTQLRQAEKKVDLVFVVNADEWNGATEIEYGSLVYSVVRAQDWKGRTELTCSRM